jgi:hypothetical protein
MEAESKGNAENVPMPLTWLLGAVMLLGGITRILSRSDIPFGIAQVLLPAGGAVNLLFKKRRTVRIAVSVGWLVVIVGAGVAEIINGRPIWGSVLLALAVFCGWMIRAEATLR